jgi:predicted nuclease of predicted toxin-antitoxin system
MRFLANENFPLDTVDALRNAGHDVAWVRTDAPGSSDPQVLQRAVAEARVLLTQDKDFGELAYQAGLPSACGIVLFRLPAPSSSVLARWVVTAIESRTDWAGKFAVVEPGRIRMRPLPTSQGADPATGGHRS